MILGLPGTFTEKELKSAFAAKAKLCHPEEQPEKFRELQEAYLLLQKTMEAGKADTGGGTAAWDPGPETWDWEDPGGAGPGQWNPEEPESAGGESPEDGEDADGFDFEGAISDAVREQEERERNAQVLVAKIRQRNLMHDSRELRRLLKSEGEETVRTPEFTKAILSYFDEIKEIYLEEMVRLERTRHVVPDRGRNQTWLREAEAVRKRYLPSGAALDELIRACGLDGKETPEDEDVQKLCARIERWRGLRARKEELSSAGFTTAVLIGACALLSTGSSPGEFLGALAAIAVFLLGYVPVYLKVGRDTGHFAGALAGFFLGTMLSLAFMQGMEPKLKALYGNNTSYNKVIDLYLSPIGLWLIAYPVRKIIKSLLKRRRKKQAV